MTEARVAMTREELIKELSWSEGGYGFGQGGVAAAMFWALERPGPGKPDLRSVVMIHGNPEKYTDEELASILEFSQKMTARYDERFKWRMGANVLIVDKFEHECPKRWIGTQLTYEVPSYFKDLDELFSAFLQD